MIEIKKLRNAAAQRLLQLRATLGFDRDKMPGELEIQRASKELKKNTHI